MVIALKFSIFWKTEHVFLVFGISKIFVLWSAFMRQLWFVFSVLALSKNSGWKILQIFEKKRLLRICIHYIVDVNFKQLKQGRLFGMLFLGAIKWSSWNHCFKNLQPTYMFVVIFMQLKQGRLFDFFEIKC